MEGDTLVLEAPPVLPNKAQLVLVGYFFLLWEFSVSVGGGRQYRIVHFVLQLSSWHFFSSCSLVRTIENMFSI